MKNILITGASGDLGRAIAAKCASELKADCRIILHYSKNKEKAQKLAKELHSTYGCATQVVGANFTNLIEVENMVDSIQKEIGTIHYLINNAAMVIDADITERTVAIFEDTLRCNLVVPFYLSKIFGCQMNAGGGGKIINISSTNGIDYYSPYSLDYDASKAGLISLTKDLAMLFPKVNVNCVCPHWMDTAMNKDLEAEFLEEEANKIIKGRFAKPEEVAELVYFLLSDKANYLTGQIYSFGSYHY